MTTPPPSPVPRHALDAPRARRVWHYPLPRDAAAVAELIAQLPKHGVTGLVPQQSDLAVSWAERHAPALKAAGLDTVVGLGKISSRAIVRALDVQAAAGCMVNQEDWKSVPDSDRVVNEVLAERPRAAERTVDCHYPILTKHPETGNTGHARIARAWTPLCRLRAPQCYWSAGAGGTTELAPDGFALGRLLFARRDYPGAANSPSSLVSLARQLYRASVNDQMYSLLAESEGASVWLWNWPEMDHEARVALRLVHALESAGFRGVTAVRDFQASASVGTDGIVGPLTARALGAPAADIAAVRRGWWSNFTLDRAPKPLRLAYTQGSPRLGQVAVVRIPDGLALASPDLPNRAAPGKPPDRTLPDPVLWPMEPGTWRVARSGVRLVGVPEPAPWLAAP